MPSPLEYHSYVRYSVTLSFVFTPLVLLLIPASIAHAQISGAPASVTSPGFGGRSINGTPPSVTSLGPRGYSPNHSVAYSNGAGDVHTHRHHKVDSEYAPPLAYALPVPYAVDIGDANAGNGPENDPDYDPEYQGGPTIFDRRGSGAASYIPPVRDVPKPHSARNSDQSTIADPDPPQPPTLLVFKDGHKLEIENYAIVGATLLDLTPGHSRRVALADLDIEATRQQNDDRGLTFQLPSQQAN